MVAINNPSYSRSLAWHICNNILERNIYATRPTDCSFDKGLVSFADDGSVLQTYARYYNDIRTHWSLKKDSPVSRPVPRTGNIKSHAPLGGLHHHYVRV
jgi:hypothetical protein